MKKSSEFLKYAYAKKNISELNIPFYRPVVKIRKLRNPRIVGAEL